MKKIIGLGSFLFLSVVSFAQNSKLDSEVQKQIDLCAEQNKKVAESEFGKFIANKKTQTLEQYLKFDERPEFCDMKYSLPALNATRKFEGEFEKSIDKLSLKDKSDKYKSRVDVFVKQLGRDQLGIATVLMNLVILRMYETNIKNLKLAENDAWLKKFQAEMVAKKPAIYEKMIAQDFRLFQWYIMNEPNLFPNRKPSEKEKIELVQKLENERKVLMTNRECLLAETCHYCVNEVTPKSCNEELVEKRTKELGEVGEIVIPKVKEAILNLNKRIKRYGTFE